MSDKTKRPILRYHGGKWKLAKWIISNFPPHRVYVEPFGGAASVLMQKPRSYAEVYNDSWGDVVNVFRVMRDPTKNGELQRLLRLTPFARDEFEAGVDSNGDPVERARRTIFRSFAGFGSAAANGEYATGFRSKCNRSGTTPAHDWFNYPDNLAAFLWRLQGVVIENRDAIDVMKQQDTEPTLHYVDPPYVHSTRNMAGGKAAYAHEMNDLDHRDIARVLRNLRGMIVLSGYRCGLYDELYGDWLRIDRLVMADGARKRVESLWLNPAADSLRLSPKLIEEQA